MVKVSVVKCERCNGTGQEPNVPAPHMCQRCPGSGTVLVIEQEAK